jgi:hypothetical protein
MDTYARTLFSIAAAFNFAVAAGLLFLRSTFVSLLRLDPVLGTNLVFLYVTAAMIAIFGWAYVCVARDAHKYRVYIPLAVAGKLLVVAAVCWPWLSGDLSWRLPGLASADLVFALLFLNYLRRSDA